MICGFFLNGVKFKSYNKHYDMVYELFLTPSDLPFDNMPSKNSVLHTYTL